jgi:hypothetical protein
MVVGDHRTHHRPDRNAEGERAAPARVFALPFYKILHIHARA